MTNIIFEVGDWSGDGHSYCAEFVVTVNKSIEVVREIHLKENEFIGSLCSEYDEDTINLFQLKEFLLKNGILKERAKTLLIELITRNQFIVEDSCNRIKHIEDISFKEEKEHVLRMDCPEAMLKIWLFILQIIDPTLEIAYVSEPLSTYYIKYKGYPVEPAGTLSFYGFDSQDRHLMTPGYGVWSRYQNEEFHNGV